ncbi:cytochrome c oxidase subunit II [Halosegnis marinus]|uniref:cytochrome-c oxidase n=1 Tax=Halosegnis marinus TaxID=3034023 RepID=A0ABD5ZQC4_9EURY|nr:cytochrome c oxidase subunit II [Halosegnis sp. DT85]
MSRPARRLAAAAAALVALLLLAEPVAAQSANRDLFDGLNRQLLYVALPLTAFVEIILVYAVVRFRNNDDPKPTSSDPALEITWTAATAVILLFVFVAAFTVLASPYMSATGTAAAQPTTAGEMPDDAVEIRVLGYQYGWEVRYPGANLTTQGELVVPTDREVYLNMSSADVIHSLFVPRWGIKQDVFPTRRAYVRTNVTAAGTVRLYCTELCGVGHSRMTGNATAVAPERYAAWLAANEDGRNVRDVPTANATSTNATA